jgi:hypothetical protein
MDSKRFPYMRFYRYLKQISALFLLLLTTYNNVEGKKAVDTSKFPFNPVVIKTDGYVTSLFPVPHEKSIGMISGKPDNETLRIGLLQNQDIKYEEMPRSIFKAVDEIGTCFDGCDKMYMHQQKILSIVNWKNKKLETEYLGVGNVLENEYLHTWLINNDKKKVLTVFCPNYDSSYRSIINLSWSFTIENLADKKREKSIPINISSNRYNQPDFIAQEPDVFFLNSSVIYRESEKYDWHAIDIQLNPINHPLSTFLNDHQELTRPPFNMCVDGKNKRGVIIANNPLLKKTGITIIDWSKEPAMAPVIFPTGSKAVPDNSHMTMSPSGKWVFFTATIPPHSREGFLLYIDPALPSGYFQPLSMNLLKEDVRKVSWITNPEGLMVYTGEKFLYWDLSAFDPSALTGPKK